MPNRLLALAIALIFLVGLCSSKGEKIKIESRPGGLSEVNSVLPQDSAIYEMVKQVKAQVFKTTKLVALNSNASLKPKFYSTQVVAGTNYFIMVEYAVGKCILLRIHKSLPYAGNKITLIDTKQPKSCAKENVKYF